MWVAYKQASSTYLKQNGRTGTLLPYLRRIIPGTRYVAYIMLVPGVWLHPRPLSWGPCLHLNLGLSQTPPAGVPSVSVPTALTRHSHQLQLRLHQRKRQNKLRTALECIPSRAKTNFNFLNLANSETCRFPS